MAEEAAIETETETAVAAEAPQALQVESPKVEAKTKVEAPKVEAPKVAAKTKVEAKGDAKTDAKTDAIASDAFDAAGLKLPEGFKSDDPSFEAFVKFEGIEKLSTKQAQGLLDMALARDIEIAKALTAANAEAWKKTGDAWRAQTAKDNTAQQLSDANTALGRWFDKDTVALFESMRFTDHPGLVKGLRAIGAAIKDDTFVPGNAGSRNGSSDARKSFPNSNMNP